MIPRNPLSIRQAALCLLALAFTVANLPAQDRKVAFRTLCLEFADGIDSVILQGKGSLDGQKIQLYTNVSDVNEGVFQTNEAAFFTESTGADGKPNGTLVGKGKLAKSNRQLFVFIPNSKKGDGQPAYTVTCYDDDIRSFGMGHVRAINLSPVPVRFVIGGKVTPQIPPTKYAQFPHSKDVNAYNMYPVVTEFLSANGQWVKGQSVSWKATDRRRDIVITLVDPKFNQPAVKMYADFPQWLETPVAGATQ